MSRTQLKPFVILLVLLFAFQQQKAQTVSITKRISPSDIRLCAFPCRTTRHANNTLISTNESAINHHAYKPLFIFNTDNSDRLSYIFLIVVGLLLLFVLWALRSRFTAKKTNRFLERSLNNISDDRFEVRELNKTLKEANRRISAQAVLGTILKDSVETGFSINNFLKNSLKLVLRTVWFSERQRGFIILMNSKDMDIVAVSNIEHAIIRQVSERYGKLPRDLNPLIISEVKESFDPIVSETAENITGNKCLLAPLKNNEQYLGVIGLTLDKGREKDKEIYTDFIKAVSSSLSIIISRERNIREKNKQQKQQEVLNQQLFAQNVELEEKNIKIEKVKSKLKEQNDKIERVNKNITSSIEYAKYIQSALLPSKEHMDEIIPEHFIFYRPKDVVSGDFYFVKKVKNFIVIAVGDCTGHGVAGALLSALSISILNDSTKRPETYTPDYTLELLRGKIKNTFKQFGSENHNGLDISLCTYDTKTKLMQYAGAFNPLIIIRDGELKEYSATRNPIGFYPAEKRFENNEIQIQDGDLVYLFSDGYYDQIGGSKRKKLTKKKFKNLLLEIQEFKLDEQKRILEETFDIRKGSNSQVDDVTVLGFSL
jgi:serine phosphatase RsbU (regulator of sigma subunit)